MINRTMHPKSIQPIKTFPRLNALIIMYLVENELTAIQTCMMIELIKGMDKENIFETKDTVVQYFHERFEIDKTNLSKHLKVLRQLTIYVPISPNSFRINPYIANRVKNLPSLWEFEELKTNAFDREYWEWFKAKGIPKGLISFVRLTRKEEKTKNAADKYISKKQHLDTMAFYIKQVNDLVEEHTRDIESFLNQRREDEMLIQQLKQQHQESMEEFHSMKILAKEERKIAEERYEKLSASVQYIIDNFVNPELKEKANIWVPKVIEGGAK